MSVLGFFCVRWRGEKADGSGWKRAGEGICLGAMSQWSAGEIHLPQLLNEEAIADEFSNWEQVSSLAAERFPHLTPRPPGPAAVTSPSP